MIKLNFSIVNPWSDLFDAGYCWSGKILENKAWEVQMYRNNNIVEGLIELTHRQDHAGIRLEFGLFSYSITFNLYDTRHWNYAISQWEVYDIKDDEI